MRRVAAVVVAAMSEYHGNTAKRGENPLLPVSEGMVCCAVARQRLATPTRPAYRGACLKVKPHLQATPNKGRGLGRGQNMASNKGESLKFGNTFSLL